MRPFVTPRVANVTLALETVILSTTHTKRHTETDRKRENDAETNGYSSACRRHNYNLLTTIISERERETHLVT